MIPYEQLHPELKDKVDELRKRVNVARATIVTNSAGVAAISQFLQYQNPLAISTGIITAIPRIPVRRYRNLIDDLINTSFVYFSILAPYYPTTVLTKRIGRTIREIGETEESPFARQDAPQLLQHYHYGMADNAGNLILLRHPSLSKKEGWEKIREWSSWHAPLIQRTRFEIQKPPKRVKETKPKARFVFAPFRLKPATSGA